MRTKVWMEITPGIALPAVQLDRKRLGQVLVIYRDLDRKVRRIFTLPSNLIERQ